MTKRALGSLLWFAASWFGFEILWSVTGVPRMLGPMLGLAVALLVATDPAGRIWGSPSVEPRLAGAERPNANLG
jgi:hypothetical protein